MSTRQSNEGQDFEHNYDKRENYFGILNSW